MTPEGKIKKLIVKRLKLAFPEAIIWMPVASGYGRGNLLDFIVFVPIKERPFAFTFVIEAKAPKGELTARQAWTTAQLINIGVPVYIVRSDDDISRLIESVWNRILSIEERWFS